MRNVMELDLSAVVEAHHPVKGGSSCSNIPGGYSGDWVICSCDPRGLWNQMATRIPILEYPAHLLDAAAPLIEARVREQVAVEIGEEWQVFREHRPVGAYLPIGQMDGDCKCGRGAWPCPAVLAVLAEGARPDMVIPNPPTCPRG